MVLGYIVLLGFVFRFVGVLWVFFVVVLVYFLF